MPYQQTDYTRRKTLATRQRLLYGALDQFLLRGYHGTSMQRIVAAANSSIGNAYFHFHNKQALLDALTGCMASAIARRRDALLSAHAAGSERLALHACLNVLPAIQLVGLRRPDGGDHSDTRLFDSLMLETALGLPIALQGSGIPWPSEPDQVSLSQAWAGIARQLIVGSQASRSADDLAWSIVEFQFRLIARTPPPRGDLEQLLAALTPQAEWNAYTALLPDSVDGWSDLLSPALP